MKLISTFGHIVRAVYTAKITGLFQQMQGGKRRWIVSTYTNRGKINNIQNKTTNTSRLREIAQMWFPTPRRATSVDSALGWNPWVFTHVHMSHLLQHRHIIKRKANP